MKRLHQSQLESIIDRIIAGDPCREIVCHVTPGGGKSTLPIIASRLITAGLADALCWVCPRSALQDQGERNFLDPFFRDMFCHNVTIRSSTNDPNPCRGQRGFITTYQAIGVDRDNSVLGEFRRRHYILVLDEFHHCELGGDWAGAMQPLFEAARYRLLMSGTLERGDGKRIAFIPYEEFAGVRASRPAPSSTSETSFIRYTRTQALQEHAILPIRFKLCDGQVEWEDKKGKTRSGKLSHKIEDANQALFTALSTEFADSLLEEGVRHWLSWKRDHPRSKCLVVTANIDHARRFLDVLRSLGIRAKIATSHDSPEALRNIKEFKASLDCLVTIAMAYEGLDCPPITHIISLTHIRSVPWIEQMIARAVRVDREAGPYRSQMAFIFAPDDFLFRQVVETIRREQLPFVQESVPGNGNGKGEGNGERPPGITPLNGEITGTREIHLGEIPDGAIIEPVQTISEQEEEARARIESHVRRFCFDNRYPNKRINYEIKTHFGRARSHMTLDELRSCLRWVRRNYPLQGHTPEFVPDGVSRTRGMRQRVPTKAQPWTGETV